MLAKELAMQIINYAITRGIAVSNLKLQKLMYFCPLYWYDRHEERLIEDQPFEAWSFGPVIREIYVDYCLYGGDRIWEEADTTSELIPELQRVVDFWLKKRPFELVAHSHRKGGAWIRAFDPSRKNIIRERNLRDESRLDHALYG